MFRRIIIIIIILAGLLTPIASPVSVSANQIDGKADLGSQPPQNVMATFNCDWQDKIYATYNVSSGGAGVYDYTTNVWTTLFPTSWPAAVLNFSLVVQHPTGIAAYIIWDNGGTGAYGKWDNFAAVGGGSYISYGRTGLGTADSSGVSEAIIFPDTTNSKLHLLITSNNNPTYFRHDFTHNLDPAIGSWTDNGAIAALTFASMDGRGIYPVFHGSPNVWTMIKTLASASSFKFTESTQLYSMLTETNRATMPQTPAINTYWVNAAKTIIYALALSSGSTPNDSIVPQVWGYTIATDAWAFVTDQYSWGEGLVSAGNSRQTHLGTNNVLYYFTATQGSSTGTKVILRVYSGSSGGRVAKFPANTALGTKTTTGTVTSITWITPRLMFQSDQIGFTINGTANLAISPQIINEKGDIVVATVSLQISTSPTLWNYGGINIPLSAVGHFIKCVDTITGTSSTWGYVNSAITSTFAKGFTYSKYLDSLGYTRQISDYIAKPSELLILGYNTSLSTSVMSNYEFRLMQNSSTSDTTLTVSLNDLITYNQVNNAGNYGMCTISYILAMFNQPTDVDTRDGLIYNLSRNYVTVPTYAGFYEPAIVDVATGLTRNTVTNSVYYYADTNFYFKGILENTAYTPSGPFKGTIQVYSTGVFTPYDTLKWRILLSDQIIVVGSATTDADRLLSSTIGGIVPALSGTYYLDSYLYKSGDSTIFPTHSYFKFTVAGNQPGAGSGKIDPLQGAQDKLELISMNNVWGKMAVVIIVMIIAFLIPVLATKASKVGLVMGVVFSLLILGLGLVTSWMPWVIIVALGLGAGIWIIKAVLSTKSGGMGEE